SLVGAHFRRPSRALPSAAVPDHDHFTGSVPGPDSADSLCLDRVYDHPADHQRVPDFANRGGGVFAGPLPSLAGMSRGWLGSTRGPTALPCLHRKTSAVPTPPPN